MTQPKLTVGVTPTGLLLTCLLAFLKVEGYLHIGWWLVFLPIYWGFAFLLLIALMVAGVSIICGMRAVVKPASRSSYAASGETANPNSEIAKGLKKIYNARGQQK